MLTAAARYVSHRKQRKAQKRQTRSRSLPTLVSAERADEPAVGAPEPPLAELQLGPAEHRLDMLDVESSYAATKALLEACSRQELQEASLELSRAKQMQADDDEYSDENGVECANFDNASQSAIVTTVLRMHDPLSVRHARVLDSLGVTLWQCGAMIGVLLANVQDKAVQVRYVFVHPSLRGSKLGEFMLKRLALAHKFSWLRVIEPQGLDLQLPPLRRACQRLGFRTSSPCSHWLRAPKFNA